MKKQSTVIASRLAPETIAHLKPYADRNQVSIGVFIRALVLQFLKNPASFELP